MGVPREWDLLKVRDWKPAGNRQALARQGRAAWRNDIDVKGEVADSGENIRRNRANRIGSQHIFVSALV